SRKSLITYFLPSYAFFSPSTYYRSEKVKTLYLFSNLNTYRTAINHSTLWLLLELVVQYL
uniref:Ovule protein n=1 Tax=Parascaris univalens TaxID=6257 RepID=A0A915AAM0_PARUN